MNPLATLAVRQPPTSETMSASNLSVLLSPTVRISISYAFLLKGYEGLLFLQRSFNEPEKIAGSIICVDRRRKSVKGKISYAGFKPAPGRSPKTTPNTLPTTPSVFRAPSIPTNVYTEIASRHESAEIFILSDFYRNLLPTVIQQKTARRCECNTISYTKSYRKQIFHWY